MIILDVEIKKAILGREEEPLPGIEYCGGWRDFANMGISCVCTYDIRTHLSRAFTVGSRDTNLGDLATYLHGKPTAGFNSRRFDNKLLHEHGIDVDDALHYDILEQIWLALGLNPDKFVPATHGGWGLDAVCGATLGIHKTGHGAVAPVWWQQGRHGKVIDYCLNDVWMTGQLLLHILQGGLVVNKAGDHSLRVAMPAADQGRAYGELQAKAFATVGIDPAVDPPTVAVVQTTGGLGIIR